MSSFFLIHNSVAAGCAPVCHIVLPNRYDSYYLRLDAVEDPIRNAFEIKIIASDVSQIALFLSARAEWIGEVLGRCLSMISLPRNLSCFVSLYRSLAAAALNSSL